MKFLFLAILLNSSAAHAHWHYNENAGLGIYQPEGWIVRENGRSSKLFGPENDFAQSEIFLASDWNSKLNSLEALQFFIRDQNEGKDPDPIEFSGLQGFRVGNEERGALFLLRIPQNIIEICFHLKIGRAHV